MARITGDGVDLYFGYPVAGEDDAVRAVHAGLLIVEELEQLTQAKRIETSSPLQGAGGHRDRPSLRSAPRTRSRFAGTTPNLAARVQSAVKPGPVGVALSARRDRRQSSSCDADAGRFELKGFDGPVTISVVTGARPLASRSAWRVRGAATPDGSGGRAEMAALMGCWVKVMGGTGVGVLMTGEAGVEKSRVAVAPEQRVEHEPHSTIRLPVLPLSRQLEALHPFS